MLEFPYTCLVTWSSCRCLCSLWGAGPDDLPTQRTLWLSIQMLSRCPNSTWAKGEIGVLRMSSFQPLTPFLWKKILSHLYLLSVFNTTDEYTLLLFVWHVQVYCVCMLYAELCFYSIYNMCSHIIYIIGKRKFSSSVISQLETCGNEFACMCLLLLPSAAGMAAPSGSRASLKKPWMHQNSTPRCWRCPDSFFPTKCSALYVLCSHLCSVLSSWWSLMDKEEPFLPCSAGAHWDQWNICCHCCWEDQGSSRAVIIREDISFSSMFSVS